MSEYKIRTQRRKRQNYAPYLTKKNEGLVSRMWSWLTPSSWWSQRSSPSPPPPSSSPPPSSPSLSSPSTSHDDIPTDQPPPSTKVEETVLITEPSAPLMTTGMEQEPLVNGMETSSWIAEDEPSSRQTLSRGGCGPGEGRGQRVVNPASPSSSFNTARIKSSHGLRTRPLLTSTPQLSPVNEVNEQGRTQQQHKETSHHGRHGNSVEIQSSKLPSIPEQSSFHAVKSVFHTTPVSMATATRSQNYTDLSLSQSPFRSPFYSGMTSFGGAASRQRLRTVKRARRESSPPVLATTVQVNVSARPHPSAPPTSLSSSTAMRILHTLDSMSSPLSDARKLPLRDSSSRQPARKRHRSAQTILSPPPVAPLTSPSINNSPRLPPTIIVPNEKTVKQSTMTTTSLLGKTLRPVTTKQNARDQSSSYWTGPPLVTSEPSKLSSLTFSIPPYSTPALSPDHSKPSSTGMESKMIFTPSFHATDSPSPLATSGGKMRSRSSRTHHSHHHDNPQEETVPVAMVPSVGLQLDTHNMPSFQFTNTLKPLSLSTNSTVTMVTKQPPNFSFSTPKPVTSSSSSSIKPSHHQSHHHHQGGAILGKRLSTSFQFSTPTPCDKTTPPVNKATPTSDEAPPLKSMSVVDILKQPDYQALTSRHIPTIEPANRETISSLPSTHITSTTSTAILLPTISHHSSPTISEDISIGQQSPTLPSLSMFAPPTNGWECETCLVHNKVADGVCVACSSIKPATNKSEKLDKPVDNLLAKFAPPVGSWECSECMVTNKPQCVACTTPKPGGVVSGNQATGNVEGGLQLESAGRDNKTTPTTSQTTPTLKPLSQFAPSTDTWTCEMCLVSNKYTVSKCVACNTARSGTTPTSTSLMFGAGGGLKLGSGLTLSKTASSGSEGLKLGDSGGLKLGEGGLKFGGSGGLKLGEGGLKFGGSGGLKLGEGGLKFGGSGGLKLGEGGLKLGGNGGLKLGEGGLKLGGSEGLKLGDCGVLKLGEGGLSGSEGLKLGEGGLSGSEGLKLGEGDMSTENITDTATDKVETHSGMGTGQQAVNVGSSVPIPSQPITASPFQLAPVTTKPSLTMFPATTDKPTASMFSFPGSQSSSRLFSQQPSTVTSFNFSHNQPPTTTSTGLLGNTTTPIFGGMTSSLKMSVPSFSFSGGSPSNNSSSSIQFGSNQSTIFPPPPSSQPSSATSQLFNFTSSNNTGFNFTGAAVTTTTSQTSNAFNLASSSATGKTSKSGFNFTGAISSATGQASNTGFNFSRAAVTTTTSHSNNTAFNFTGAASGQTSNTGFNLTGAATNPQFGSTTPSFNFTGNNAPPSYGQATLFQPPSTNQSGASAPSGRVIRRARRRK